MVLESKYPKQLIIKIDEHRGIFMGAFHEDGTPIERYMGEWLREIYELHYPKMGSIYFMQPGVEHLDCIKVGFSNDPLRRSRELHMGLLGEIEGLLEDAREIESFIHKALTDCHLHVEREFFLCKVDSHNWYDILSHAKSFRELKLIAANVSWQCHFARLENKWDGKPNIEQINQIWGNAQKRASRLIKK